MFDCSGTSGDFIFLFYFSEIILDLFFKRQKVLFYNIPDFFGIHLVITVNQKMSHCYQATSIPNLLSHISESYRYLQYVLRKITTYLL